MDGPDETSELTMMFRFDEWQFGPLHSGNILDYFAFSPFYDRASLNERRRQAMHTQGLTPEQAMEQTRFEEGIEYVLLPTSQEPELFLIRKEYRAPKRHPPMTVRALYYIVDGTIYAAPDLLTVCSARLNKVGFYLRKAVEEFGKHVTPSPTDGPSWDFEPLREPRDAIPKPRTELGMRKADDSRRVNDLLKGLHLKHHTTIAASVLGGSSSMGAGGAGSAGAGDGAGSGSTGVADSSRGGKPQAVVRAAPAEGHTVPSGKRPRPA